MRESRDSFRTIVGSSGTIGSAYAINYLVSILRIKIVAVLIGPAGIGLIGLYGAILNLVGTACGMGLGSSGVRAIAESSHVGDLHQAARTAGVLRRMCWFTGGIGWVVIALLAYPLSQLLFGSTQHADALMILGCTLVFGAVAGGETAILQGLRRIGDLARVSVWTMLLQTATAVPLYYWLREKGIVPVMITSGLISLLVVHWYAKRLSLPKPRTGRGIVAAEGRGLLHLGAAFMWSGLLTIAVDIYTRSMLTRSFGLDAAGQYQAAWALSGLFAAFVLSAMGTDYYPRLTGIINDHPLSVQLVNQQTEIGLLIATPGLLLTAAFSPWVIQLLYTAEFAPAAEVLPWFILGVFGRVISWPLGYVLLARGDARCFAIAETGFSLTQLSLVALLVPLYGVAGAAYSFALVYLVHSVVMLVLARRLIQFSWSRSAWILVVFAIAMVSTVLLISASVPGPTRYILSGVVILSSTVLSLRGLAKRLGSDHKMMQLLLRIPGGPILLKDID